MSSPRRMLRALDEFEIEGVTTLMPFHKAIMASEQWANAETCRDLIEDRTWLKSLARPAREARPTTSRREGRAHLHGRGVRQALRGQGPRRACPPRPRRRAGAGAQPPRARAAQAAAAAAGTRSPRRCRATCGRCSSSRAAGRGGPADLHHRGDEDGERDHGPQGRHDRRAPGQGGRGEPIASGATIAVITSAPEPAQGATTPRTWIAAPQEARRGPPACWPPSAPGTGQAVAARGDAAFLEGVERLIGSPWTRSTCSAARAAERPHRRSPRCAIATRCGPTPTTAGWRTCSSRRTPAAAASGGRSCSSAVLARAREARLPPRRARRRTTTTPPPGRSTARSASAPGDDEPGRLAVFMRRRIPENMPPGVD